MVKNPLVLRCIVDGSGYHWAKVDASGRGKWITKSFRITETMIRKAPDVPETSLKRIRPGYYISSGGPYPVGMGEPGRSSKPWGPFKEIEIGTEAPALFREFADTPCTPEGIKGFVDRWGLLGNAIQQHIRFEVSNGVISHVGSIGEPADRWAAAIHDMREAVRVWNLIRNEDEPELSRYLRRKQREEEKRWRKLVIAPSETISKSITPGQNDKSTESWTQLKPRDILTLARDRLRDTVNSRLGRTFSPHLASSYPSDEKPSGGGWDLYFEPACLIDALWFQLALAIRGNIEHRQCAVCAGWFEIATGAGRKDKKYCSVACQMRAYRKRKAGKT